MHEYTLSNHDRKRIYYSVAFLSSLAGGGFAFLLAKLNASMGIGFAAPSGFAVFGLFFIWFDTYLWKWPALYDFGLIKIPNLNGQWDAEITSSVSDEPISATVL